MIKKLFLGIGMSYSWMGMAQFSTTGTPAVGDYFTNEATKLSIGTGVKPSATLEVNGDAKFNIANTQTFKVSSPSSSFTVDQSGTFASQTNGGTTGSRRLQYNGYLSVHASLSNQSHAFTFGTIGTASGLHFGTALSDAGALGLAKDYSIMNTSNNALALGTNNIERIRISNIGNVSIGGSPSSNTAEKLLVNGTIKAPRFYTMSSGQGGAGDTEIIPALVKCSVSGGMAILMRAHEIRGTSTTQNGLAFSLGIISSTKNITGFSSGTALLGSSVNDGTKEADLGIFAGKAKKLVLGADKAVHMTIQPSGNVGIGIADPTAKLHIVSGTVGSKLLQVGNQVYFSDVFCNGGLGLRSNSSTNKDVYLQLGLDGMVLHSTPEKLSFGKFASPDGGVFTPVFNLRNNGTLAVKELCTNPSSTWCDYVFAKEYKLRKLSEVESYIAEHQHLPEIPASAEIEKDGIKIAEMITLQMKKIEELTLYLIAQEKRIQELETQLKNK